MRTTTFLALLGLTALCPSQSAILRQALINPTTQAPETVRGSLSHQKGIALTADGRLWALVYVNDGGIVSTDPPAKQDASMVLHLYTSVDGGTSWSVAARARTLGSVYGSMVTGLDGYTLHVTYYARNGRRDSSNNPYYSIYYSAYDTRGKAWQGTQDQEIVVGTNSSSGTYSTPDIAVADNGVIGIVFNCARGVPSGWVGSSGSWCSGLIWNKGGKWSAPHRLNSSSESSGCNPNIQAWRNDFYASYRTTTGGYGTSVRRFDTVKAAFGGEGEIPVMPSSSNPAKNVSNMYANNVSCLAVQPNGDLYVLFATGTSHTGGGKLWYAIAPAGTYKFGARIQLDDDPSMGWGNNTYRFYNLARTGSGGLIALYSKKTESNQHLYMRALGPKGAVPPYPQNAIPYAKGVAAGQFYMLSTYRDQRCVTGDMVLVSDTSAVGPLTGGKAVFFGGGQGAAIFKGLGCHGNLADTPYLTCAGMPTLGSNLGLSFTRHPASTSGLLLVGIQDLKLANLLPLPLDLGPLGLTGCHLHTDLTMALSYSVDASGAGALPIPIPNVVELKGIPVFFQSLLIASGATPANLLAANGLGVTFR